MCAEHPSAQQDERGSVLLLMPAAVLVVLVLGAIAVDAAIAFLGEREVADAAAAAANDAAVAGLRGSVFYECGRLQIDPTQARSLALETIARRRSDAVHVDDVEVAVLPGTAPRVTVAVRGHVDLIFTPALAPGLRRRAVSARSTASTTTVGAAAQAAQC